MPGVERSGIDHSSHHPEVLLKTLFVAFLLLALGCTSSEKAQAELARLQESLVKMEQEAAVLQAKYRDAGSDTGLKTQLLSDQENLKSRMERLKEMIATHSAH